MNKQFVIVLVAALSLAACKSPKESAPAEFNNFTDSLSYVIGADLGKNFRLQEVEVNDEMILKGFQDAYLGNDSVFSEEVVQQVIQKFQVEQQKIQKEKAEKEFTENNQIGQKFLMENKAKEGVKTTESGLQYKVLRDAEGAKPLATSTVEVNYEGRLINGTIFDSSYERGESISFPLNQVIPGWTEGLQLMTVGSMYELYIPAELGYGNRSVPGIPAGSTLIFKVELLGIK